MVKISGSFRGAGSIPDWGAKIPHVSRPKPPEHEKQRQAINAVWRKGNPLTLLVGMQTSTATMENSVKLS